MPSLPLEAGQSVFPLSGANPEKEHLKTVREENAAASLEKRIAFLCDVGIPVLRSSVIELARLRENEDNVTARDISEVILRDPMLTLKVLRYLQDHRGSSQVREITTVSHAVMMLGVTPFFREFREMDVVEDILAQRPHALEGFMGVVARACHAASHAGEWAALRHDIESDEVVIGALLHDVAEMLLWCLAPESMTCIAERMHQDRTLRSVMAQEDVLGFRVLDLQLALVDRWHLPVLLNSLMDDEHPSSSRARIVALAAALARHSAHGWDDAALPHDYEAIQKLLGHSRREVMDRIWRAALRATRRLNRYRQFQPAAWLPPAPCAWVTAERDSPGDAPVDAPAVLRSLIEWLETRGAQNLDFLELLSLVFHVVRYGIGLERMLFLDLDGAREQATARYVSGPLDAAPLRKCRINLSPPGVFSRLANAEGGIWYRGSAHDETQQPLPEDLRQLIGQNEFFAMPILMNGDPVGLIYADGGRRSLVLDAHQFSEFQQLCRFLTLALERGSRLVLYNT
jgi:HD-like signal output (HDOD) protein